MSSMPQQEQRLAVLDGWRALSILFVLATHLLPLGPKAWQLNSTAGPLGMSLFFTLSGFLITQFLLKHQSVSDFLIRRFFRIIPLAWLYIGISLVISESGSASWLAHLFFYANWPPMALGITTSHFWSLCVEVQFYIAIALLVALLGRRGLLLIPFICIAFTMYRVSNEVYIAINTYFRVDEILAGSILALIYSGKYGNLPSHVLKNINQMFVMVLLVISCHPDSGFMNYLRPYLAALLVGTTLYRSNPLTRFLHAKVIVYIAATSYALYIIHPLLAHSWLGSGGVVEKYAKRPLLFLILFASAHVSTFYYEHKWISLGKRLSLRLQAKATG